MLMIGSVLGFIANAKTNDLQIQVNTLKAELSKLHAEPLTVATSQQISQPRPTLKGIDVPKAAPIKEAPKPTPLSDLKPKIARVDAPPPTPKPPASIEEPKRSFEEELGARWAVWVGGIALIFGAIFLLRYTIEAGVFTPAMRITLAAVLGICSLIVGEYLRRKETELKLPQAIQNFTQTAYIPGILTAVGIFSLLGSIYAAYAIYGFIGSLTALFLLGSVSLGALGLSLLQGPKIAALGLTASLITPLLVATSTPNYIILYIYLTIISLASLALAKKRKWAWLTPLTLFGGLGWGYLSVEAVQAPHTHTAWIIFLALIFSVGMWKATHPDTQADTQADDNSKIDPFLITSKWTFVLSAACAVLLYFATIYTSMEPNTYYTGLVGAFVLMLCGWRIKGQSHNLIFGGILAITLILSYNWYDDTTVKSIEAIYAAIVFAILIIGSGFHKLITEGPTTHIKWSLFTTFMPVLAFMSFGMEYASNLQNYAALALGTLTLMYAGLTETLWRKAKTTSPAIPVYAFATALSYLVVLMLKADGNQFTVGLIVPILVSAGLYSKRPLPVLRWLSVIFALLSAAYILLVKIPIENAVSETFIFNTLWLYFALPAALCAGAYWLFTRDKNDIWPEGLKALALSFISLFFVFQIRHIMNDGDILAIHLSLEELAMQVLIGLSFTLGGTLLGKTASAQRSPEQRLVPALAMWISFFTLVVFGLGVCIIQNPLFNVDTTINGGMVVNTLMLAYLLPTLALGAISWLSRHKRPALYVQTTGGLALVSFMIYVTSMIRLGFNGPEFALSSLSLYGAELYSISIAWLLIGIALLALGIKLKHQGLRLASAIIIMMTVFKAFFIDMATLEGILRAISFVVLGIVLIVIGRVYQKLLFSKTSAQKPLS